MDDTGEFGLPYPKRIRIGERHGDIQQPSNGVPSNPGTPIDDLDDLYGSLSTVAPSPAQLSEELTFPPEIIQQPVLKPSKFQLPGLGLLADDGHPEEASETAKPANCGLERERVGDIPGIRAESATEALSDREIDTDTPANTKPSASTQDLAAEKDKSGRQVDASENPPARDAQPVISEDVTPFFAPASCTTSTKGITVGVEPPNQVSTAPAHASDLQNSLDSVAHLNMAMGEPTSLQQAGPPTNASQLLEEEIQDAQSGTENPQADITMDEPTAMQQALSPTDDVQLLKEGIIDANPDTKSPHPDMLMGKLMPLQQAVSPIEDRPPAKEGPRDAHAKTDTSAQLGAEEDSVDAVPAGSSLDAQHVPVPDTVPSSETVAALDVGKEDVVETPKMDLDAEFEMDSSPIESSSDSSSDSSTSDDSDDYQMLDPEEQARRLMQEDGGSDGEGAQDIGAGTTQLRTLNEKPDEVVPKPNITITPEMKIQELGEVENLVENLVLIKAKISGEYQVLESGSVLCLGDRNIIGVVAETLGRVQQPYYSVRFTNAAGIAEAGISKGTTIYYSELHSTTVFTQPLKSFKGSDASNIHDEEVADDELEFSDDEAEAEYKRKLKHERQAKKDARSGVPDGFSRGHGGRGGNRGRGRGRGKNDHRGGRSGDHPRNHNSVGINYDDMDTDEPYTPLARPSDLHEMMGRNEAPIENRNGRFDAASGGPERGTRDHGTDRGERGRGDRSRDHRGGRGGQPGRDSLNNTGHEAPLQNRNQYASSQYPPPQMDSRPFYPSQPQFQPSSQTIYGQQQTGYPLMQNNPPNYGFNFAQPNQQFQYPYQSLGPHSAIPNVPPGAFINPAFFAQASQNPNIPQNPSPLHLFSQNNPMRAPARNNSREPAYPADNKD